VPKERSILVNVGLSFFIVTVAEIVYVDKYELCNLRRLSLAARRITSPSAVCRQGSESYSFEGKFISVLFIISSSFVRKKIISSSLKRFSFRTLEL
jgi:hypothetical protein